ncbi:MAG: peptidase [Ferruginibacter sp.]|nr:peptidase [Ferruginibacter sp.]
MATATNPSPGLYTYRNGKKVYLNKEPDQFVIREKPEELTKKGIRGNLERVSSSSTRVTVNREELNPLMDELRKEAVTHHAYTQQDNDAEFLITDRVMVTFKQPVSNEILSQFMAKYALILRDKYSDKEYLFQLTDQTSMNPVKLVVQINETESALVESCEHDLNKRMTVSTVNVPADAKYLQQWHLHTKFTSPAFDTRASANCEAAWNLLNHFGSSDVVIAISDDGCKIDHSDFDSPNKFAQWGYFQGNTLVQRDSVSADPLKMYQSGADHGTCCSGVIAAEIDGSLTVGAAPGCRLLPVKWESDSTGLFVSDSKMMTLLTFIADKADVLSNSWGSSPESNFSINVVNKIGQLAQNGGRRGKGIVFLWAAGNENCPIKYTGNLDIPYDNGYNRFGSWQGVRTARNFRHNLTSVPGVMYVAALASNAQRSHYSNYGEGISICAPSSNSHEYWRMAVTGLGILTTSGRSPFFDSAFGGTSSATPLVAGIAGLIISANPSLSALEVVSVLQKTAGKNLNMTSYPQTPAASFDPTPTWDISPVAPYNTGNFTNIGHPDGNWSGWFGFGKADAAAAVAEALRLAGNSPVGNSTITKSSSPSKPIPDNNPTGIADTIVINNAGTVAAVKIDLDITHTYIGDLVIGLTSPRGTPAILHERNGGSAKNIVKTFDLQSTPALSRFKGESANGNWTLEVSDAAAIDSGTLNKWTLIIETGSQAEIKLEDSPGTAIPDVNPAGIERSLNVTATGTLKEIEIAIDITHTYIGDLIVNLVSPSGAMINLHSRSGGDADNIIKTFNFANNTNLKTLVGQQVQGNWKLKVSDVVGQDVGKLNKWSLRIIKE